MKKGFTLVELLAVIVILAIICFITIPIALNIVSKIDKQSAEIGMESIENAAKLYYNNQQLNNNMSNTIFICSKGNCSNNGIMLELNGVKPQSGEIIIDKDGNITMDSIILDGFLCKKNDKEYECEKINE